MLAITTRGEAQDGIKATPDLRAYGTSQIEPHSNANIMTRRKLILSEITSTASTTGVNRYISLWLDALQHQSEWEVVYIRFEHSRERLFVNVEDCGHYQCVRVPMPEDIEQAVNNREQWKLYIEAIYPSIKNYFKKDCLLHLHTINLIDLALRVKQDMACQTLMHLHCIPWKGSYNSNLKRFVTLMAKDKNLLPLSERNAFYQVVNEHDAYTLADHIICVTNSGRHFLIQQGIESSKISVIYNGLPTCDKHKKTDYLLESPIKLLFVGNAHRSKGLEFVLQALQQLLSYGYPIELHVAGNVSIDLQTYLKNRYPGVSMAFLGTLSYEALCEVYVSADIGIIASLQEQCSYAAIEMMQFGLPIITTGVDGLGEMFIHEENALITHIKRDETEGITIDIDDMIAHLVRLCNDRELRERLAKGAKTRYSSMFDIERMSAETRAVYHKM